MTVITLSSEFRKPVDYVEGIKIVSCRKRFDMFKTAFMPGLFWKMLTEDCDVVHDYLTVLLLSLS